MFSPADAPSVTTFGRCYSRSDQSTMIGRTQVVFVCHHIPSANRKNTFPSKLIP